MAQRFKLTNALRLGGQMSNFGRSQEPRITSSADHAGGEPRTCTQVQNGAEPDTQGRGRAVLIIEDEPHIAEAIRFLLTRDGWAASVHASGKAARELIAQAAPVVVILDAMLPEISGFDVLRAVRSDPEIAELPVILLTANSAASARDMARNAGASLFMPKPFANADLLQAVRALAQE